jgi:hypothetical protein
MVSSSIIKSIAQAHGHNISNDKAIDLVACVTKKMSKGDGLIVAILSCLLS